MPTSCGGGRPPSPNTPQCRDQPSALTRNPRYKQRAPSRTRLDAVLAWIGHDPSGRCAHSSRDTGCSTMAPKRSDALDSRCAAASAHTGTHRASARTASKHQRFISDTPLRQPAREAPAAMSKGPRPTRCVVVTTAAVWRPRCGCHALSAAATMLPSAVRAARRRSTSHARGERVNDGEMRSAKLHHVRSDRRRKPQRQRLLVQRKPLRTLLLRAAWA